MHFSKKFRNSLIKAGVPDGATVAHKSGATMDVGGINGCEKMWA